MQAVIEDWEDIFNEPQATPEEIHQHFKQETSSKRWAWYSSENYGLNYKEEYRKHRRYRKDIEMAECGQFRYKFNPASGKTVSYQYRCKHFDECKKCGMNRKREVIDELERYAIFKKEHLVCDEQEAKRIVRGLDKEKYRRYPLADGQVLLVSEKDVIEGSAPLVMDMVFDLGQSVSLSHKRMSGKLVARKREEKEEQQESVILDFDQLEEELFNPTFEVKYREFSIEFDYENKSKPQCIKDIEAIAQQEVQILKHPETEEQLQDALYVMEQITKKVCDRYGLSFNFYITKKSRVKKNDIDWQWLKEKLLKQ